MTITYEDAAKEITLKQAIWMHKKGISVIIDNGKDITFEIEKEPIRHQTK